MLQMDVCDKRELGRSKQEKEILTEVSPRIYTSIESEYNGTQFHSFKFTSCTGKF